jgi:predicted Zn-dependent peptidase
MEKTKNNTLNRRLMPEHGKSVLLAIDDPVEIKLDNGMAAYLIEAGEEEVTRIDFIVKAGSAYQDKSLVAGNVCKLLKEGTKNYSSAQIANLFDYFGSYLSTSISKDKATITLYSLTKHLERLLPVVSDMLKEALFQTQEIDLHLHMQRQEFLVNREKVKYKAQFEFNRMVFGAGTAYGQIVELDDFDKVERDDLVRFFKTHYNVKNTYIVVSGKTNHKVPELLNKHFGSGLSQDVNKNDSIRFVGTNGIKEKFIEKPGAMQSAIRIGRPMINKTHPDYNRFILLNTILGGYFGSRLMSNLREDKGFTYGVSSFTLNFRHGAAFSIATQVNAKHTREAIDEICNEMKKLRQTKISSKEIKLVKNYIYGTFLRNFDGPFALSERFSSVKDFGLSFDYYRKSLEEILLITADDLIETANKYLNPDDMIKLVVGNKD